MQANKDDAIRASAAGGAFLGIGVMAALDEIVFHQLLAWHHFYDLATPRWGIFSDGLLHAAELMLLVAGFFSVSRLRGQQQLQSMAAWAGCLLGIGGFQLFDGVIDHKLLRLHQIRYDVPQLLLYDLAWNVAGVILLLLGLALWRRVRVTAAPNPL